jgi:PII-like signaling protein
MTMSARSKVQRVRIYLNEADRHEGQALYLIVLERLQREGATGASALRGLAGFGPGQRHRFNSSALDKQPPVVIEWIDRSERIARILPQIAELMPTALITLEDVQVYRAVLRGRGPIAVDVDVSDLMAKVPALTLSAPVTEAITLLAKGRNTVAVVNEDSALVGTITAQDIAWRADFYLPTHLLPLLSAEEGAALVAKLDAVGVEHVMNREPRSVMTSSTLSQVLITMTEWGLADLPVVDHDGKFCGQIDDTTLLKLVVRPQDADEQVRDAEPATPVSLIMQTSVPHIAVSESLRSALAALLATPERMVLITDAANRLLGAISARFTLEHVRGDERAAFLAALQQSANNGITALPGADRGCDELLERDLVTVAPAADLITAAHRLLASAYASLPVVDEDRHLLGAVSRRALLRALLQQTT